ncbi:transporter [Candidimonas nitroreducens]|uniref:transporter n=1 Tax=Candidimonas nitroreducens TaxID=683354 RepID=UPI0026D7B164
MRAGPARAARATRPAAKALLALLLALPAASSLAHPLVSDDTGTVGAGHWQYELNAEQTAAQPDTGRQQLWSTSLTYGATDTLDVYANLPYTRLQYPAASRGSGPGDTEIGMKWRLLEDGAFSFALKPRLMVPTGSSARDLGSGRPGGGATLLAEYSQNGFTAVLNSGALWQPNDQGKRTLAWQASAAALYALLPTLQVAAEIGASRNLDHGRDDNPAFAIVGAIYSPTRRLDLDVGYRKGLNSQTYSHSVMAGLTLHW